ncbi:cysteine peptidase family C39 domain-containing protein, partial [Okeania sp. SIO2C9]|uniref:cysteine peptidase family C39 domain-containing protein n=1 Tax=Okeania sp. SIO2C9 TaxID=2607791 RepID=UPI00345C9DE9
MRCCCLRNYSRLLPPFCTLAQLRQECGVSRDGSKASNVLKAARNYGLNAKGLKKSLASLQTLCPPYIVFWNFNHFLVVEGFGKNRVYLNDPATGPRKVSLQEFDEGFTGVILVMEPGPEFNKGGKPRNMFSALTSRLRNSRRAIGLCLLTGLFLTLPRLA